MSKKRIIGGILGVAVLVVFLLLKPDQEVWKPEAMAFLGCLCMAVIWMVFNFVPDYVAAITMCTMWVVFKSVPIGTAFNQFNGSTVWIMIGALILGTAAGQCGFLKRCALLMMKALPATYSGQCLAFVFSGVVLTPLIPSTAAKSTIIPPMVLANAESLGIQPHSKPAKGIFLAYYIGYITTAVCFLSGSFISYSLNGVIADAAVVTWMNWFLWSIVFLVSNVVLMILIILLWYRPKEKIEISKEFVTKQLDEMGVWTWQQKLTGITLVSCLVLWIFERALNIPSWAVACIGAMLLMVCNVMTVKDLRAKIPWDSILMIGCFVGVGSVATAVGIDATVRTLLGDTLGKLMSNPFLLIIVLSVVTWVLRSVLTSMTTATTITTVLLLPLCASYGIHPWILIFVGYASGNIWWLIYQTAPSILSFAATDNKLVTHSETIAGSVQFAVTCLVALLISIPYWQLLGLL